MACERLDRPFEVSQELVRDQVLDTLALSQRIDGLGGFDQLAGGRQVPSCQIVHCPVEGNVEVDTVIRLCHGERNLKVSRGKDAPVYRGTSAVFDIVVKKDEFQRTVDKGRLLYCVRWTEAVRGLLVSACSICSTCERNTGGSRGSKDR